MQDYIVAEKMFLSWLGTGGTFMIAGLAFAKFGTGMFGALFGVFLVILGASLIAYSTYRYCYINNGTENKTYTINPVATRFFGTIGTFLSAGAVISLLFSQNVKNSLRL